MAEKSELVIPVLTPSLIMGSQEDQTVLNTTSVPPTNPDFVLVWNKKDKDAVTQIAFEKRSVFEYNLEEEGLILEWGNSKNFPELHVVKIWAPLEVLKRYSEILKLRIPMKDMNLCDIDISHESSVSHSLESIKKSAGWFMQLWGKLRNICSLDEPSFTKKCRKLTGPYSRDREYLFDLEESNIDEIFPLAVRARIVQYILRRTPYKTGEALELDAFAFGYERLIQKNIYVAGYPLHDGSISTEGSTRKLLYDNWGKVSTCFKVQPLDAVKDYFGVNIALYFAWLGFYTRMLLFAAIFGGICFFYGTLTISSDPFVKDVCNETLSITMCPLCDYSCRYWKLSEKCAYAKFAHLFDNEFSFIFAISMSVWAAVFLELWKRYAARITNYWDLSTFDLKKDFNPRPEYVAELKKIYPNGKDSNKDKSEETGNENEPRKYDFELTIPFWSRKLPFTLLSYSTVFLLVIMAIACLAGVIFYRLWFTLWLSKQYSESTDKESEQGFAWQKLTISITAAFFNLTFIVIFGQVYQRIAVKLTEMEFPRTQTEFDSSYTLKIYMLEFINNYSSIFYVAFFKGAYAGAPEKYHRLFGSLRQEECGGIGCMPELCVQLAVIMLGKQTRNMIMEAFLPWLRRGIKKLSRDFRVTTYENTNGQPKKRFSLGDSTSSEEQWAQDYDLLDWGNFSLTDEYLDMVLQLGFVTIFAPAFPLASIFALINNIIELRLDSGKMLRHYKRPVGLRAKDIGIWSDIIDGIVKIAVVSNACIMALTSNFIPKLVYRFLIQDTNDPNYGTLNGYLENSLTSYDTEDLESRPDLSVIQRTGDSKYCYFHTYRHNHDSVHKYEFRMEHWQIWLARVIFVLLYQNFVNLIMLFVRWVIPDVPNKLRTQMQREERLVNDLIVEREKLRSQKFFEPHHHRSPNDFSFGNSNDDSKLKSIERSQTSPTNEGMPSTENGGQHDE